MFASVKSYLLTAIGVIYLASITLFYHSCNLEKCVGVKCSKFGTCVNGACQCNTGYEGSDCSIKISNKFVGVYNITSTCFNNNQSYLTKIIADTNSTNVDILNMANLGMEVTATVSNSTSLIIPPQTRTDVNSQQWTISGDGSLNSEGLVITLNLTYVFLQNNMTQNCIETYTKK